MGVLSLLCSTNSAFCQAGARLLRLNQGNKRVILYEWQRRSRRDGAANVTVGELMERVRLTQLVACAG